MVTDLNEIKIMLSALLENGGDKTEVVYSIAYQLGIDLDQPMNYLDLRRHMYNRIVSVKYENATIQYRLCGTYYVNGSEEVNIHLHRLPSGL